MLLGYVFWKWGGGWKQVGRANPGDNGVVTNYGETPAPFVTPQKADFSRTVFFFGARLKKKTGVEQAAGVKDGLWMTGRVLLS